MQWKSYLLLSSALLHVLCYSFYHCHYFCSVTQRWLSILGFLLSYFAWYVTVITGCHKSKSSVSVAYVFGKKSSVIYLIDETTKLLELLFWAFFIHSQLQICISWKYNLFELHDSLKLITYLSTSNEILFF